MNIRLIPGLAALVPFVAVHVSYVLAASHGHVEWCFPYIDSCTSISATGRQPPESFVFRALMIPSAMIMMAYWWINYGWLSQLATPSDRAWPRRVLLGLGVAACLGLILYVTVLGEVGTAYARARRTGTILFFSFTFLSQLLLVGQLRRRLLEPGVRGVLAAMLGVCVTLLAMGILSVVLGAWDQAYYDTVEDAFEWVFSLLLQINFALGYLLWRRAGLTMAVCSATPASPVAGESAYDAGDSGQHSDRS